MKVFVNVHYAVLLFGLTTVLVHKYCGATQSNIYDFQAKFLLRKPGQDFFFSRERKRNDARVKHWLLQLLHFFIPPSPLFLKKEHFIAPPSRGKEFSIERERSVIFNKVLGSAHQAKPLAV